MTTMDLQALLRTMVEKDGSDLFLTVGAPPSIKVFGRMQPMQRPPYRLNEVKEIAYSLMNDDQRSQFDKSPEMNLAIMVEGIGRFRVNIFQQRGQVGIVARTIKTEIPHFQALGLPDLLTQLIMHKNGLILFVGGTGSGKSTSLASLIDYRNRNSEGHIITIEDPVEFLHSHQKCIINQREVGVDTVSDRKSV